jgi:hypothetical protein
MLIYALWFFAGVLAHKFFSYLLNLGYSKIIFDRTIDSLLLVVDALSSDIEFALEMKQKHLSDTGISDETLNKSSESDKKVLLQWKDTIIIKMAAVSLEPYRSLIRYKRWSDAQERVKELKRNRGQ